MPKHGLLPCVINLFAGPGAGKSTTAAGLFERFKWGGISCELVTEYAKDKVWEGHLNILENQFYVFGKQLQRILRLKGKVDVIITDSPIIMSIVYNNNSPLLNEGMMEEFRKWNNVNILLKRSKPYVQSGRYQDEAGARHVDDLIEQMLDKYELPRRTYVASQENVDVIANDLKPVIEKFQAWDLSMKPVLDTLP